MIEGTENPPILALPKNGLLLSLDIDACMHSELNFILYEVIEIEDEADYEILSAMAIEEFLRHLKDDLIFGNIRERLKTGQTNAFADNTHPGIFRRILYGEPTKRSSK